MTPEEFRAAREAMGLTAQQAADVMGYGSRQRIYEIEAGRKGLSQASARLMRAYLDGYRPSDWPQ
jgi:transcriptional regulator with XRE-family HTH domain